MSNPRRELKQNEIDAIEKLAKSVHGLLVKSINNRCKLADECYYQLGFSASEIALLHNALVKLRRNSGLLETGGE